MIHFFSNEVFEQMCKEEEFLEFESEDLRDDKTKWIVAVLVEGNSDDPELSCTSTEALEAVSVRLKNRDNNPLNFSVIEAFTEKEWNRLIYYRR